MLGTIIFKDNTTLDDPFIRWENGETEEFEIDDVVTLSDGAKCRLTCDIDEHFILGHEFYDMEGVIITKIEKKKAKSPYIG